MMVYSQICQFLLPFVFFVTFCSDSSASGDTITGRVTRVIDGDTVVVEEESSEGQMVSAEDLAKVQSLRSKVSGLHVRLAGIDAPELKQSHGLEAKLALEKIVLDQTVVVEFKKRDRYGRILDWLYVRHLRITTGRSGPSVNHQLIAAGHAWHAVQYSRDMNLAKAQTNARNHRCGLWAKINLVAPWKFRRRP